MQNHGTRRNLRRGRTVAIDPGSTRTRRRQADDQAAKTPKATGGRPAAAPNGRRGRGAGQSAGPALPGPQDHAQAPRRRHDRLRPPWLPRGAVDDIVKVARTSHGTFYLHFSNKEDLLRALVGEAGEVVAALDASLGSVAPTTTAGASCAGGWTVLRRLAAVLPVLRAWSDLALSDAELTAQGHAAAGGVAMTLATRIAESGSPSGHRSQRRRRGRGGHGRPVPLPAAVRRSARRRRRPRHAHHHGPPGPVRRRVGSGRIPDRGRDPVPWPRHPGSPNGAKPKKS